jgi:site-specific DNA-methyltransferase (adenine-specific)
LDEFRRVLKPNGSLYLFASPQMAWGVEGEVRKRFNLLTNIRWQKPPFSTKAEMFVKEDLRAPFPASETILFAEHPAACVEFEDQSDGIRSIAFESIRQYLVSEFERAGMLTTEGKIAANVACGFSPSSGGMASRHYFSTSQWQMPTKEHYEALRRLLNRGGETDYLRREYEDLRREYEDLRREYEDLRREFSVTSDDQYTDVWTFPTVGTYPGKHECEKPADMIRQIVRASSRIGDTVLDGFAGSGVTGQVCVELGRRVILVEKDEHWYKQAVRRCQHRAPERQKVEKTLPLFD